MIKTVRNLMYTCKNIGASNAFIYVAIKFKKVISSFVINVAHCWYLYKISKLNTV